MSGPRNVRGQFSAGTHLPRRTLAATAVCILAACSALARLPRLPSDAELVRKSDIVFIGRWDGRYHADSDGLTIRVSVINILKGNQGANTSSKNVFIPGAILRRPGQVGLPDLGPVVGLGANLKEKAIWFCRAVAGHRVVLSDTIGGILPLTLAPYFSALLEKDARRRDDRLIRLLQDKKNPVLRRRVARFFCGGPLPFPWTRVVYAGQNSCVIGGNSPFPGRPLFQRNEDEPVRDDYVRRRLISLVQRDVRHVDPLVSALLMSLFPESVSGDMLHQLLKSPDIDNVVLALVFAKTHNRNLPENGLPFDRLSSVSPNVAWGIMDYAYWNGLKGPFWLDLLCGFLDCDRLAEPVYSDGKLHLSPDPLPEYDEDECLHIPSVKAREIIHCLTGIWVPYWPAVARKMVRPDGTGRSAAKKLGRDILQGNVVRLNEKRSGILCRLRNTYPWPVSIDVREAWLATAAIPNLMIECRDYLKVSRAAGIGNSGKTVPIRTATIPPNGEILLSLSTESLLPEKYTSIHLVFPHLSHIPNACGYAGVLDLDK